MCDQEKVPCCLPWGLVEVLYFFWGSFVPGNFLNAHMGRLCFRCVRINEHTRTQSLRHFKLVCPCSSRCGATTRRFNSALPGSAHSLQVRNIRTQLAAPCSVLTFKTKRFNASAALCYFSGTGFLLPNRSHLKID